MQFFVVYIREAHALDSEWPMTGRGHPLVQEPVDDAERRRLATQCTTALELAMIPTLVDGIDDAVGRRFAAWPDRLFLVGKDGKIAYAGGPGPAGFKPEELEAAIKTALGPKSNPGGGR